MYELRQFPNKSDGVFGKFENQQLTGAYKIRGALNKLIHMNNNQMSEGVVTASTGNHAQGVLKSSQLFGVDAKAVLPNNAPQSKINNCKQLGGDVIIHGKDYQEAKKKAHRIEKEENRTYFSSYDDPHVISGSGTVALEILDNIKGPDEIFVPIGGGGIISGVATAVKAISPETKIIGVQAEGANSIVPSIEQNKPVKIDEVNTIADGIAVNSVGNETFDIIRQNVDEFEIVSDESIRQAMRLFIEHENQIVEPAGAATAAALFSRETQNTDKKSIIIMTGGNIDFE
jgi:threonine dehydratase